MAHERRPSFAFGPFVLDVSEQVLTRDGRAVQLAPKLFDVLCVLLENHGHLVTKETFIARVWDGGFVEEGALTRTVSTLRKVLGDTLSDPTYIETVPKRGYRFVAPVTMHVAGGQQPTRPTHVYRMAPAAAAVLAIVVLGVMAFTGRRQASRIDSGAALAHSQVTFTGTASAPAISQDGQRIAYIVADASGKRAVVRDLGGGDPVEIFRAPELGYLRWSPDDHQLLVWARGEGKAGVYRVSTNGAAPQQIAPQRFLACWSPDGSIVAVPHYMGGEIALRNLQGVEQRTLSLGGKIWSIWDLDWSPNTGVLAVVSNDFEGHYTIWTIQPDGTDQRKVIQETGEITTVRWAPDGRSLYYSYRQHQTVSLKSVMVPSSEDDLSEPTAVLSGLEAGRTLSISGDGKRLVYARAPFHSNLWLLALDQINEKAEPLARPLTNGTSYVERPRISPDGTEIAFNVGHEPRTELYRMPLRGGEWTQLTNLGSTTVGAAWSPDGTRIAFASTEGEKPQIWTVEASGGVPRRRSTRVVSDSFDLSWSPAGITFQSPGNRNYTVLNVDTGEERPLVNDDAGGWMFSPVANAQGQVAVFWARKERGIWVVDPARQQGRLVYSTTAGSAYPIGWSATNDSVYVVEGEPAELREISSRLGETMKDASILEVPVAGGEPKLLARIPFGEIGVVALTPDARKAVVPVFSSQSDIWLMDDFQLAARRETPRKRKVQLAGNALFGTDP